MAKGSKLLAALDAHKGRDYAAEKRKAQVKAAEKRKRLKLNREQDQNEGEQEDDFEEFDDEKEENANGNGNQESVLLKKSSNGHGIASGSGNEDEEEEDEGEQDELNDSDVPLSDLDPEDLEDTIPHQRMTINNTSALVSSRNRISLLKSSSTSIPFHVHNSLISTLDPPSTAIPDPNDDLTRELEFYRIARTATVTARSLLKKEFVPFTRPTDYFAEMVKSDDHMTRIKKKMYDDAAGKKASAEAKKLRDAKKFGKQVQVAKEQERAKEKRETLDKIKDLKRKRKGNDTGKVREDADADLFQSIAVESAPQKDRSGRDRGPGPNVKRQKRDQKFGFGGKKRFSKSGDALSSGDLSGFSAGRMKGKGGSGGGGAKSKAKRPGKSRRAGAR